MSTDETEPSTIDDEDAQQGPSVSNEPAVLSLNDEAGEDMKKATDSDNEESTTSRIGSRTSITKSDKMSKSKTKSTVSGKVEGIFEDDELGVVADGDCRLHHTMHIRQEALCCQYSQDGRLFAMGILNSTIRIYDPPVVNCLFILTDPEVVKTQLPVTCVRFQPSLLPGARRIHFLGATYASGFVKIWKVEEKVCTFSIKEDRQTLTLSFSLDGSVVASAGSDAKIYIYDINTVQRIHILRSSDSTHRMDGHQLRVFCVVYHPQERHLLLSGGWDNIVHIWDDREQHSVRSVYGPHVCGDGIDVLPEENLILTASWHKRHPLQLWDFLSGDLLKDIRPDSVSSLLYCGQFMKKNFIITGGSNANVMRIIDRISYTTIGALKNLPNAVFCISSNPFFVYPKVVGISGDYIYVVELKIRRSIPGPD